MAMAIRVLTGGPGNDRAHWLYLGQYFTRTGVTGRDEARAPFAEWLRDG